jgi:hypothetical protein
MAADEGLGKKLREFGAIVLHTNGLLMPKLDQTILWDDVTAVDGQIVVRYHGSPVVIGVASFTITLKDGEKITLPIDASLESTPLVSRVHDEVNARFLPRAREVLRSGKTLPFGPIEATEEGLKVEDRLLPWNDFAGLTFDPDNMYLWAADEKKPSHRVRLKTVRRPGLLMALAQQLTGANTDTFHTVAEGQTAPPQRRQSKSGAARPPGKIPNSEHTATLLGRMKVGGAGSMLSILGVVLGIGLLVLALVPNSLVVQRTPLLLLAAGFLACGPAGVIYLVMNMRGIATSATIGPKGLAWRSDGEEHERPWGDVREVWNKNARHCFGSCSRMASRRTSITRSATTTSLWPSSNRRRRTYSSRSIKPR